MKEWDYQDGKYCFQFDEIEVLIEVSIDKTNLVLPPRVRSTWYELSRTQIDPLTLRLGCTVNLRASTLGCFSDFAISVLLVLEEGAGSLLDWREVVPSEGRSPALGGRNRQ